MTAQIRSRTLKISGTAYGHGHITLFFPKTLRMIADQFIAHRCAFPSVFAVSASSTGAFARHTHDQFGIGVIDRGAQTSHSGRGAVSVQAGDIITVNPAEVHDGLPVDAAGRSWRMLYFDPTLVAKYSQRPGSEFCWPTLRDPRLTATFQSLFAAMISPKPELYALSAEASLLTLFAALCDRPAKRNFAANITAAKQRLQDDPAAPISIADLASLSGLGPFHFLRSFSAATGLTPHAYQIQCRLHLARQLISQKTPLAEAAVTAGFADQSHLTRLFRRSFGLTPGSYARVFG